MLYDYRSFCTICVVILLIYLSLEDLRIQRIDNWELMPILVVGVFITGFKLVNSEMSYGIYSNIYYIIGPSIGFFLYSSGLFGGADLKILLILLMIIEPTNCFGITQNLDGIQFFYYLLISILFSLLIRLVHNIWTIIKTGCWKYRSFHIQEILFLCVSCRFLRLKKATPRDLIQLKLGLKEISFHNSMILELGVYCWSKIITPMFPFITISFILTIFT
jgi:Flp pilus assembly protein protease CpaA